jgi:hypothetical protein
VKKTKKIYKTCKTTRQFMSDEERKKEEEKDDKEAFI